MNTLNKNRIRKLITLFIATSSIIWGFVESLDAFGLISVAGRELKHYLLLVLACILISFLINYLTLNFWYKRIVQDEKLKTNLKKIKKLKKITKSVAFEGHYHKAMFIEWRVNTLLEKIKKISAGHITLDAKNSYDYIIYIFGSIIKQLNPGDTYLALSNLDFWTRIDFNSGVFLSENAKALARGVCFRRIIIVDESTIYDENKAVQRQELCRIVNCLRIWAHKYPKEFSAFIEFTFFLSNNYAEQSRYPVPYAILVNNKHSDFMTIIPQLHTYSQTPTIDIYFTHSEADLHYTRHLNRFEDFSKISEKKYDLNAMHKLLSQLEPKDYR